MRLFSFLFRYSPRNVLLAVAISAVSGASNAALLALLNARLHGSSWSASAIFWCFVGLCVFLPLTRFTTELFLTRVAQNALFEMRMRISRQILDAPLRSLEEFGLRRLMTALTEDLPAITGVLSIIAGLCINAAVVVSGFVYLGLLSWRVLLAVCAAVAVCVLVYQLPTARALHYHRLARQTADSLFQHFHALNVGAKELKLHRRRREAFLENVLRSTSAALRGYNLSASALYSAAASCGQALVYVIIALVLFGLPEWQQVDGKVMSGFAITLLYLMTPFQGIMNAVPMISRTGVAFRRIEALGLRLAEQGAERKARQPVPTPTSFQRLELVGVTHTYRREGESSDFTVGPVDLTISPGELLFLVGGNGSGKTTLAKVLTGLYVPESGEIRLDGRPVDDESREFYREHFTIVFSDFFLFETLLGLDSPGLDDRARAYISTLRLEHKVKVEGGVLSTTELSQGQRKRLALLTAYLEDRPVYIFDEWAADQDPQFKETFYHQLLPELKARGKTLVVISHDDRYYHLADRIIKMDYGQVVGAGSPALPHPA
ncbi:MAG TPA: cyclic peptide export ABC transporter [Pyrinomonadaceae bacterium]|jgi:putative ATP-binding cassette transporter